MNSADFVLCLCKFCGKADRGRLAGQRRQFKIHRKSTAQVICKRKFYITTLLVSVRTCEPEIKFVHRFLGLTSGIRTCLSSGVMGPSVAMLSDRLVLFSLAIFGFFLVSCSFN